VEMVKMLLKVEGIDVNIDTKYGNGNTSLDHACDFGHLEVAGVLLRVPGVRASTNQMR